MTDNMRPVKPLIMPGVDRASIGEIPTLKWLPLSMLVINDDYQRSLSERSTSMIRKIVANFDWAHTKALSVIPIDDGRYEVIDGQHTAIAAASHGGLDQLPCLISPPRSVEARAAAFVGLNRDRLAMTMLQVFWAEIAAGDEIAHEVLLGVNSGGGRVLKSPPALGRYDVGDVVAIVSLKKLADNGGPAWVKRAVSIGVRARLAPIRSNALKAFQDLVWPARDRGLGDQTIIDVIRIHGWSAVENRARTLRELKSMAMGRACAAAIRELADES